MWRFLPAVLVCAAALGGCGGEDGPPARTVRVEGVEPVRITAKEYSFDPSGVVFSGARTLHIRLDNRGSLAHNLRVFEGDRDVGGTESFPGGEQRSAAVKVGPGDYRLVCTVGDHEEKGMHGTLLVR